MLSSSLSSSPNRPPSLEEAALIRSTIQSEERLLQLSLVELERAKDAFARAKESSDAALRVTALAQANLDRVSGIANGLEASIQWSRGSLGAVRRLPAEILDDIFLYVVDGAMDSDFVPSITDSYHPALTVMRVCKRWHNIALNASRLWRRIHLCSSMDRILLKEHASLAGWGSHLQYTLSRWLSLSKTQLLSLSFSIDFGPNAFILDPISVQHVVPPLCRTIISVMDRCESLEIRNSDFLLQCVSAPTPRLKRACLIADSPHIKHPLLPSAPSLTQLTTRRLYRTFRILPFSTLESLSITEEWSCTLSDVIALLGSLPTLRSLSLSILDGLDRSLPAYVLPPQPAELPHLRHLTIWEGWSSILPHLSNIDNLDTLIYRFAIKDRGPPPTFPFRIVQRFKSLRRLEIGYPWPELEDMVEMEDEEKLLDMLAQLQKLEHLEIENAGVTEELLTTMNIYHINVENPAESPVWLCPKLKTIAFKECWEITGDAMLAFVRHRRAGRTPEEAIDCERTLVNATLDIGDRHGLKSPWQEWQLREMAALLGTTPS